MFDLLMYKTSLWYWKRRFLYPMTFLFGFLYSYHFLCNLFHANLYEKRYRLPTVQPYDFTQYMMTEFKLKENREYIVWSRKMLLEMLKSKGELSPVDWLIIGAHFSKAKEEEMAYQAYYMAHMLDHEKIETNGKL